MEAHSVPPAVWNRNGFSEIAGNKHQARLEGYFAEGLGTAQATGLSGHKGNASPPLSSRESQGKPPGYPGLRVEKKKAAPGAGALLPIGLRSPK